MGVQDQKKTSEYTIPLGSAPLGELKLLNKNNFKFKIIKLFEVININIKI